MSVFAKNLTQLVTEDSETSRSETCHSIGVTRRQLHQYMNGEVEPRSNVLFKILSHFQVDERILFSPVEQLRAEQVKKTDRLFDLLNLPDRVTQIDEAILESGFYVRWRASFEAPGLIAQDLMLVTRANGITQISGRSSTAGQMSHLANPANWKLQGRIHKYGQTFAIILSNASGSHFSFELIHHAHEKRSRGMALTGICLRQPQELYRDTPNKTGTLWERIHPEKRSVLSIRRSLTDMRMDMVPPHVAAHLGSGPANLVATIPPA